MEENIILSPAISMASMFGFHRFTSEMQLKIIYLFMKSDGECSEGELKKFDELCESMNINQRQKREIVGFCECLQWKKQQDNSEFVISQIEEILKEKFKSVTDYNEQDKNTQAFIIWTLLNLAYADAECSKAEKSVIEHLINMWEMDSVIVNEIYDTVKTALVLTNQIQWIKTTNAPYDYVQRIVQEYENNIKALYSNIEIAVSEVNI